MSVRPGRQTGRRRFREGQARGPLRHTPSGGCCSIGLVALRSRLRRTTPWALTRARLAIVSSLLQIVVPPPESAVLPPMKKDVVIL